MNLAAVVASLCGTGNGTAELPGFRVYNVQPRSCAASLPLRLQQIEAGPRASVDVCKRQELFKEHGYSVDVGGGELDPLGLQAPGAAGAQSLPRSVVGALLRSGQDVVGFGVASGADTWWSFQDALLCALSGRWASLRVADRAITARRLGRLLWTELSAKGMYRRLGYHKRWLLEDFQQGLGDSAPATEATLTAYADYFSINLVCFDADAPAETGPRTYPAAASCGVVEGGDRLARPYLVMLRRGSRYAVLTRPTDGGSHSALLLRSRDRPVLDAMVRDAPAPTKLDLDYRRYRAQVVRDMATAAGVRTEEVRAGRARPRTKAALVEALASLDLDQTAAAAIMRVAQAAGT